MVFVPAHVLSAGAPDGYIVRAEAHIIGIEPRISRTLELPIVLNFAQLHEVLQASFGWTDRHLHQFNIGGIIYGAPEFDDGFTARRIFEATELRMVDFVFSTIPTSSPSRSSRSTTATTGAICSVWNAFCARQASIILAALQLAGQGRQRTSAARHGYAEFLEAWRDSGHEEHKSMHRCDGRKFHPENCDLDAINMAIAKAVRAARETTASAANPGQSCPHTTETVSSSNRPTKCKAAWRANSDHSSMTK